MSDSLYSFQVNYYLRTWQTVAYWAVSGAPCPCMYPQWDIDTWVLTYEVLEPFRSICVISRKNVFFSDFMSYTKTGELRQILSTFNSQLFLWKDFLSCSL